MHATSKLSDDRNKEKNKHIFKEFTSGWFNLIQSAQLAVIKHMMTDRISIFNLQLMIQ